MDFGGRFRRRSTRLAGYDYSSPGAYFVTICTREKQWRFGEVIAGGMLLNSSGSLVQTVWREMGNVYPEMVPEAFVVMPNHVHGIIIIKKDVGARLPRPDVCNEILGNPGGETPPLHDVIEPNKCKPSQPLTLGRIVAYFKYQTTRLINRQRATPGIPLWQRNYHDHIVRDQAELNQIRQYILENPINWPNDSENSNT